MSYLHYLDKPTHENVRTVYKQSNKTQAELADIAKIKLQTIKGWLAEPNNINHRTPSLPTWNFLIYELEARERNYQNILHFFEKNA